jgi:hypothetical protein
LLWEVGNTAFSAYVAQEPLKNERPITYESRDPNGSLLTGLRGKKLQTRVSKSLLLGSIALSSFRHLHFGSWYTSHGNSRGAGRQYSRRLIGKEGLLGLKSWMLVLELSMASTLGSQSILLRHRLRQ